MHTRGGRNHYIQEEGGIECETQVPFVEIHRNALSRNAEGVNVRLMTSGLA